MIVEIKKERGKLLPSNNSNVMNEIIKTSTEELLKLIDFPKLISNVWNALSPNQKTNVCMFIGGGVAAEIIFSNVHFEHTEDINETIDENGNVLRTTKKETKFFGVGNKKDEISQIS